MKKYTNLVFKGGGVKGIAYAGAILELDKMGILPGIKRVAGTSAGAITAALLALGYTSKEVENAVREMDFASFKDKGGLVGKIIGFLRKYGWYKGDTFKSWLGDRIKEKTGDKNTTFKQLKDLVAQNKGGYRELYVVATNLNKQYLEIFSVEQHSEVSIVDAVRMSMSIPLFFNSVTWNQNIMVDGGMGYNYAIDIFDHKNFAVDSESIVNTTFEDGTLEVNQETLGLWIDTKAGIDNLRNRKPRPSMTIHGIKDFSVSLVDYLMEMANMTHLEKYDWERSILIDSLDVKATDFDGVKAKADQLIESGKQGVIDYFKWLNAEG